MTNEEALPLIKATDHCYVLWSAARNEVVAVRPVPRDASADERSNVLATLWSEGEGPLVARFFESASVSIATLRDQQAKFARLADRRRTLNAWRTCEVDDLLRLLETAAFPQNTSARLDAHLLIDEIYYARAAALSSQQLARLEAVAARRGYFSPLGTAAADNLECRLAVIRNDRQRLERFWRLHLAKQRSFSAHFAVAAGDLPLDLDDVIENFAAAVTQAWPFETRFTAMLALGKIGAAAGERTAGMIAANIYDSSERVSRLRDQVLLRIRTPSSHWKACGSCVRGMVPAADAPGFERCAVCLGLGHVHPRLSDR